MKKYIYNLVGCAAFMAAVTSCFPEQEVAPIDPPTDNAVTTITPQADYANVQEGDTMYFDVAVDKMVRQTIDFSAVFTENSTADASDIEIISGSLPAYKLNATIAIVVLADGLAEANETLSFHLDASEDIGYNFQLHPDSDSEMVEAAVSDYDFTLDFSGTYEDKDMCDWHVDLDIIIFNADQTVVNYDGATGDCPLETGSFSSLPDDTYNIYVDHYGNDFPAEEGVSIPWVVYISNNSGELYQLEGSFNSDNAGDEDAIAGQVVIANGTYTIYDAEGNEVGTI